MSEEQLYLTGPVIANGIPDSDNDTLNSVEIRTIFTKYTKHLTDIQHDAITYDGVEVLANWISETDNLLRFRKKEILQDSGKISYKQATQKAENEYEKYKVIQDKKFVSDFDKLLLETENINKNET